MVSGRVRLALPSPARHVPSAILIGTKERTTFVHALRYTRLGWVNAVGRALWVASYLLCGRKCLVVIRPVPIDGPLPDIACHIK